MSAPTSQDRPTPSTLAPRQVLATSTVCRLLLLRAVERHETPGRRWYTPIVGGDE
jgi:hypothetical protein